MLYEWHGCALGSHLSSIRTISFIVSGYELRVLFNHEDTILLLRIY
jgi:hypothetical protein